MELNIEIETYEKNGKKMVFLAHNGSSGCSYPYNSKQQLMEICADYAKQALEYEIEMDD